MSVGKLAYELVDVFQGQHMHFIVREIADRVRQFDHRMTFHAAAFELVNGGVLENLCEDHRRRYAAFFELHGVVHTAQRAGASPADGGDGNVDFVCQFIQQFERGGF